MDESLVLVHAVDHEGSSAADIVDSIVRELLDTGSFNLCTHNMHFRMCEGLECSEETYHNVKAVLVVLLDLSPLSLRVRTVEIDVLVRSVELTRNVRLHALVGRNDDLCRSVLLEQLSEDKTGRSGA